jgi:hypothetical protein
VALLQDQVKHREKGKAGDNSTFQKQRHESAGSDGGV